MARSSLSTLYKRVVGKFWFANPRHSLGDVSMYSLPLDFGGSINRLFIYCFRKYPLLQRLFPVMDLGEWPSSLENLDKSVRIANFGQDESCVTYIGHRTVYIRVGGATFLTDPVFSRRILSGAIGVRRVDNILYKYWELPAADFLLISSNSYDCLDSWTLRKISDCGGAIAIGGRNITKYLNMFFKRYTYPLNWFENVDFGSVNVTFVPGFSETKRKLLSCGIDRNLLLWGGFLISANGKTVYYAGKTAYSKHFKSIGDYVNRRGGRIDLSILPIGPIFRQKRNMTPEEAVIAHLDLNSEKSLVVAHDTFPLGIESYGELKNRLYRHIDQMDPTLKNKFIVLKPGDSLQI